ncbi:MAG: hypothetical protein HYV97_01830 [Bdellovibrio sp.]|nr:hypothetical protein [Bdellovibrio sp.]
MSIRNDMIGDIGKGKRTFMFRHAGQLMSSILNLLLLTLSISIGTVSAVVPEADDGASLLPADLEFERPSPAKLAALAADTTLDTEHKRKLLACLSDLEKKIRELMKQPQAKLDDLLQAQADMALLKVAKAFLELQKIEKKFDSDMGSRDRRLRAIGSGLSSSGATKTEMSETLDSFYQYIALSDQENGFTDSSAQDKLLNALENFSKKKLSGTERTQFAITATDKYIIKNLYSKYQPANLPTGESNLFETIFNQLGRNFKTRDLGESDRRSLQYQMTCTTNCTKKGALTRYTEAKAAFVKHMKDELKKFLLDPDKNHNCKDFYDPNTLKMKTPYRPYETYMCSTGGFLRGLTDTTPFQNIENLLNFMSKDRSGLGPINPQIHARRMFHNRLSCKFKKKPAPSKDWEVELELYMEHLHGSNEADTTWFINTGKPPTTTTIGGGSYNSCDRAGSSYSNYSATTFATSDKCIDRPVHHNNGGVKHEAVIKVTVNLGDTHQDSVILRGTSEPRGTMGVTIRPRPAGGGVPTPRVEGTDANGGMAESDVSTRIISLDGCSGSGPYNDSGSGAANVSGIEIIDQNGTPVSGVGLRPESLILQARTTPVLSGGRYRWSCEADIPGKNATEQAEICNKVSKYHENNATFPRLDVDYTVKVQYTSSVQRPEAPTATKVIPKRKPITFEFQVIPEKSDDTKTTVKLVYTGEENKEAIIDHGTLRWKTCPTVADHPAIAICGPGKSLALDTEYTFPFTADSYRIDAEWKWAPNWPAVITSKEIGRTEIGVDLVEKSHTADAFVLRPTVHAPTSGDIPDNSKAAIVSRLKWSCTLVGSGSTVLPELCNNQTASVTSDTTFPRLVQAYTVTAVTSKKIGSADHPIRSNSIPIPAKDAPVHGVPNLEIARQAHPTNPDKVQIKVTLRSSTAHPLPPGHTLTWVCEPARSDCSGSINSGEWKDFNKDAEAYTVKAVYTSAGSPSLERSTTVPRKDSPASPDFAVARVGIAPNSGSGSGSGAATHIELKANLTFTPPTGKEKHPRVSFKWMCGTERPGCNPTDIVGNEGIKQFEMDANGPYDVKAVYVETDGPGDTAVYTIPQKPSAVAYNLEISEDKTPDAANAKFEASVFKSGSYEDVSGDGTIEWIYKSPGGSEIKKTGKTIEAERGTEDIKGKAVFKVGTEEKDSEEFTIKKKPATDSDDDPGLEPLPDIPPSPPPARFTPIILPPMPGMFITPGFD